MKKFAIFAVIFAMCVAFVGCTITVDYGNKTKETEATTEPETEDVVESVEPTEFVSDIPDAAYFDIIDWPTFGAATKVPAPDWSNRGTIYLDSETGFWCEVGYSTLEDYKSYVKACQDLGFVNDYYSVANYIYYGANDENYAVQIGYNEYDHYVSIQVTADASSWNKWWEDEN